MNLKLFVWSRNSDANISSDAMESCHPEKHLIELVTSFMLSFFTRIVASQFKHSFRNAVCSHVSLPTETAHLCLLGSLRCEVFMQLKISLNFIRNSAVSLLLLPTICECVSMPAATVLLITCAANLTFILENAGSST